MFNVNSVFSSLLLLVGRLSISLIFIVAGMHKIMEYQHTMALMSSMGVPFSEFLIILAIIFELGGGVLLFFGLYTRLGTFLLLLFVVAATCFFHSFWDYQGAAQVENTYHFFKNLTMFGGLLYVFVHGGGRFSLDKKFRNTH